jgi:hypothetical protein
MRVLSQMDSVPLQSIRMRGTVTGFAKSQGASGTITLEANGPSSSRVEMAFADGTRRIDVRGERHGGLPWGAWADAAGQFHAMALHNCWGPPVWFLPQWAALQPAHGNDIFELSVSNRHDLGAPERLRRARRWSRASAAQQALIERLSAADLILDRAGSVPQELHYNLHPDRDLTRNIEVTVRYSDYRAVDGIHVPFRIREYLGSSLMLDIVVTSVDVNQALPAADFVAPQNLIPVRPKGRPATGNSRRPRLPRPEVHE